MRVSNEAKIGTHFKRENIFLATIVDNADQTEEVVKGKANGLVKNILGKLIKAGAIKSEQFDIFYKDENGYTRYVAEGPETFVGDNSDGKGVICNVVPIFDYYTEDMVKEVMINESFYAIVVKSEEPLYKYNEDYNKK